MISLSYEDVVLKKNKIDEGESFMKKSIMLIVLVCCLVVPVGAVGMESLYDLIVPQEYSILTVSGGLGSAGGVSSLSQNAFEMTVSSGGGFSVDLGAKGDYLRVDQTADTYLLLSAHGELNAGVSGAGLLLRDNQGIAYKAYGLDIEGMDGFFTAGGSYNVSPSTSGVTFRLAPYTGIGIGRSYDISTIIYIELMMKHLGLTPTEDTVRAAAEVMYTAGELINRYTDDLSENYVEYYNKLAEALGVPERAMEVRYIGMSQVFDFEQARYNGFSYGWEAMAGLEAELSYFTSFNAGGNVTLNGVCSGFLMENMLYYKARADIEVGFNSGIVFNTLAQGNVVYLPEDYHWWAEGGAEVSYGLTPGFGLKILGEGHYLLNPQFDTYAGVSVSNSSGFAVFSGGQYRIW